MRLLNKIYLTAGVVLLLSGCGSSGSFESAETIIPLSVGEEMELISGDRISPVNEETQIELRHVLGSDKKYVTLVSGSAELIRGSYIVN